MQGVLLARQHNGVARIRPAGKPHDDLAFGCQKIDDLPFAFVPPLGSYIRRRSLCAPLLFFGENIL